MLVSYGEKTASKTINEALSRKGRRSGMKRYTDGLPLVTAHCWLSGECLWSHLRHRYPAVCRVFLTSSRSHSCAIWFRSIWQSNQSSPFPQPPPTIVLMLPRIGAVNASGEIEPLLALSCPFILGRIMAYTARLVILDDNRI